MRGLHLEAFLCPPDPTEQTIRGCGTHADSHVCAAASDVQPEAGNQVQKLRHVQTMGYRPCIIWLPAAEMMLESYMVFTASF